MKKGDRYLLLAAAVVAILLFAFNTQSRYNDDKTVVVTIDGITAQTFDLSVDIDRYDIVSPYGHNIMQISKGVVKVTEADCPDKVCVHTKAAKNVGDVIVCLPHRLIISIEKAPKP